MRWIYLKYSKNLKKFKYFGKNWPIEGKVIRETSDILLASIL